MRGLSSCSRHKNAGHGKGGSHECQVAWPIRLDGALTLTLTLPQHGPSLRSGSSSPQAAAPRSSASPERTSFSFSALGPIRAVRPATAAPAQLRPGVPRATPRASGPLASAPTGSLLLPADTARGPPPAAGQCAPSTPPRDAPTAPRPRTWGLYADWPPRDPARQGIGPAASRQRGGGTPGVSDSRNAAPSVPDFGGCIRVASPRLDRRVPPTSPLRAEGAECSIFPWNNGVVN
ncbi:atherin-like [Rhinolophus ferrumequinum]|uniref:atherin-like n=1 Tax=Rhinolophus ferrumequinum TaxID=59479 RepID=UPI00140FE155|nr:atherin-like [Rhinolophus ferrumequinum]